MSARQKWTVRSISSGKKYGEDVILRARFVNKKDRHMVGGLSKERRTGVTKPVWNVLKRSRPQKGGRDLCRA